MRPWFRNVPKSLRKQPKVFLWDWSLVADEGARRENLVASHLLKAGAKHAFQVAFDLPFADIDLFSRTTPVRVPVLTFLSQLL